MIPTHQQNCQCAVYNIAHHLEGCYFEEIQFQNLAVQYGICSTYLSTLFRKYLGTTPSRYLIHLRVEKAKQLITHDSKMPLGQIASCVGYHDPLYFSRVFKAKTGWSPSAYRLYAVPANNSK